MIKYLATASLLLAGAYLSTGPGAGRRSRHHRHRNRDRRRRTPDRSAGAARRRRIDRPQDRDRGSQCRRRHQRPQDQICAGRRRLRHRPHHPGRQEGDRRRQGVCPARHLRLRPVHRRDAAAGESRHSHRDRRGAGQIPLGTATQERVRGRAILRGRHHPPRQLSRRQEPRQEMGPDHAGRRLRHHRARRFRYRGQGQEAQRGLQRQLQEGPAGLLIRHAAAEGIRRRGVSGRRHHRREHRR